MSLLLSFVTLAPGEDLVEALAREAATVSWDAVISAVTPLLPDADLDEDTVVDQDTGFEVMQDPLTVVVPYGVADDDEAALLLRLVTAIEGATGLTCDDPYTGEPALAGGAKGLDAAFAASMTSDDERPGLAATLLRAAVRRGIGLG